ncbi:hypothetical protein HU715_015610 [Pseudomonas sp. SWRI12]|uniref:CdiI immunity protein domain-containing protein n=1 Tax=Pseudomonas zanjanensis TaxID=2745496 RepID=A0A923FJD7_9PSED|nr:MULTISPECIES: contact-dependent growth inhibition system immunity protein [Pseudomonas]MBV4496783.1 hypothetical protein [Pseudomonas zanjanensis]MCP1457387.1 hypothetical protein [Pseudomonas kilonensis]
MNKELPELHDFFGAYFHQDWSAEHESAEQVLEAFLAESGVEILKTVQQELDVLLGKKENELELREYLLKELSCYYSYWNTWEVGKVWLRHIASRLSSRVDSLC